jgi:uncharacterized short protein YbdD (DUF466 family)
MKPAWMDQLRAAYCGVFGVPDYAAYLLHMAERHPEREPLTREQFARLFIDRRYGAMRPRCC